MVSNQGPETIHWINEHGVKFNSDAYITLLSDDFILQEIKRKGRIFSRIMPLAKPQGKPKIFSKRKMLKILIGHRNSPI